MMLKTVCNSSDGGRGQLPTRSHGSDAGLDLRSSEEVAISPGCPEVVDLGVAVQIPQGHYGMLTHRSSLAFKKNCIISTGIIDSNYTGTIKCLVVNVGTDLEYIDAGERIAQLIIQPYRYLEPVAVDTLDETDRGASGIGSTGEV